MPRDPELEFVAVLEEFSSWREQSGSDDGRRVLNQLKWPSTQPTRGLAPLPLLLVAERRNCNGLLI